MKNSLTIKDTQCRFSFSQWQRFCMHVVTIFHFIKTENGKGFTIACQQRPRRVKALRLCQFGRRGTIARVELEETFKESQLVVKLGGEVVFVQPACLCRRAKYVGKDLDSFGRQHAIQILSSWCSWKLVLEWFFFYICNFLLFKKPC